MRYLKWAIRIIFVLFIVGLLHYTLPQQDIARITDTYEKRIDFGTNSLFWSGGDSGSAANTTNRDVFFIQAFRRNEKPMIYRNEDTGFGWPLFFKFDTSNLQAEASDMISKKSEAETQWVVVRHYGWRNEYLSIYPNALSIRPIEDPNVRLIPWGNIIRLTLLAALFWGLWVRWVHFREARIDPRLERVDDWMNDKLGR